MSESAQQAFIDAPVEAVWRLLAEVDRHPEWWPRVVEVHCEGLEEGCTYRQVTRQPLRTERMDLFVERLDDCEELTIRCVNSGTFVNFMLTEARGGTFVDARMGMEPRAFSDRVFDAVAGKRFFRSWLRQTLEALSFAARRQHGRAA